MIKGTPISSPIISNNGNPTHYDEFGVGGYREVSTKNDMYGIVPYESGVGDNLPQALKDKTLYMAVPLALGGIYCEFPLKLFNPDNKIFVLDSNYLTTTSDTIMSFTTGISDTYIDSSNLSGIMYIHQPDSNPDLDTDVCIGIKIPGYDKNSNTVDIG